MHIFCVHKNSIKQFRKWNKVWDTHKCNRRYEVYLWSKIMIAEKEHNICDTMENIISISVEATLLQQ